MKGVIKTCLRRGGWHRQANNLHIPDNEGNCKCGDHFIIRMAELIRRLPARHVHLPKDEE